MKRKIASLMLAIVFIFAMIVPTSATEVGEIALDSDLQVTAFDSNGRQIADSNVQVAVITAEDIALSRSPASSQVQSILQVTVTDSSNGATSSHELCMTTIESFDAIRVTVFDENGSMLEQISIETSGRSIESERLAAMSPPPATVQHSVTRQFHYLDFVPASVYVVIEASVFGSNWTWYSGWLPRTSMTQNATVITAVYSGTLFIRL